jgi:hypothetical protein
MLIISLANLHQNHHNNKKQQHLIHKVLIRGTLQKTVTIIIMLLMVTICLPLIVMRTMEVIKWEKQPRRQWAEGSQREESN